MAVGSRADRKITCREFIEFMMSYLDGELGEGEREVFEVHLGACQVCLCYLKNYEEAVEMGRCACRDPDGPPPDDVPDELIRAILAARKAG